MSIDSKLVSLERDYLATKSWQDYRNYARHAIRSNRLSYYKSIYKEFSLFLSDKSVSWLSSGHQSPNQMSYCLRDQDINIDLYYFPESEIFSINCKPRIFRYNWIYVRIFPEKTEKPIATFQTNLWEENDFRTKVFVGKLNIHREDYIDPPTLLKTLLRLSDKELGDG